ncbi:MAG: hypothetical protein ACLP4R_31425 [Solirubrobacteraceae bacterium]
MTDSTQAGQPNGDPRQSESIVTTLMHEGAAEADALLEAVGMREQLSGEAHDLARRSRFSPASAPRYRPP